MSDFTYGILVGIGIIVGINVIYGIFKYMTLKHKKNESNINKNNPIDPSQYDGKYSHIV
jgi:hypothetical protein